MGQPQSYKDIFKNIKKVPLQHTGNSIKTILPRLKSDAEIELEIKLQKNFVKFSNEQRCLVCGDQLDGAVHPYDAQLYCVSNNGHYKRRFNALKKPEYTFALYSFDEIEYEVIANLSGNGFNNFIYKLDKHLIPKFRQKEKKLIFNHFSEFVFEFPQNLNQDEFEQNMKILMTFS